MVKHNCFKCQSLSDWKKDTEFEKCFVEIPYIDIDSNCLLSVYLNL